MNALETIEWEFSPPQRLLDNYEKLVISMECTFPQDQDGIKITCAIDYQPK